MKSLISINFLHFFARRFSHQITVITLSWEARKSKLVKEETRKEPGKKSELSRTGSSVLFSFGLRSCSLVLDFDLMIDQMITEQRKSRRRRRRKEQQQQHLPTLMLVSGIGRFVCSSTRGGESLFLIFGMHVHHLCPQVVRLRESIWELFAAENDFPGVWFLLIRKEEIENLSVCVCVFLAAFHDIRERTLSSPKGAWNVEKNFLSFNW